MQTETVTRKKVREYIPEEMARQIIAKETEVRRQQHMRASQVGSLPPLTVEEYTESFVKKLIAEEVSFPVTPYQLGVAEKLQTSYVKTGKVITLSEAWTDPHFRVIRLHNATGRTVTPVRFRKSVRAIYRALIRKAKKMLSLDPKKTVVVPLWRAGCWMGLEAYGQGFKIFLHYDVKRDEVTHKAHLKYVSEMPAFDENTIFLLVDPMLATAGSLAVVIDHLLSKGVSLKNIYSVHLITAPEGVVRIIEKYGITMIVGAMDEYLNTKAYIEGLGLGDAGDLSCEGLSPRRLTNIFKPMFNGPIVAERFYQRAAEHKQAA